MSSGRPHFYKPNQANKSRMLTFKEVAVGCENEEAKDF